jgi:hypothetical protein
MKVAKESKEEADMWREAARRYGAYVHRCEIEEAFPETFPETQNMRAWLDECKKRYNLS